MAQESTECEPEPMDSTDTLCVIFTSGTTDVSKPIMHTQAGYLLQASVIFKVSSSVRTLYSWSLLLTAYKKSAPTSSS